MSLFIMWQAPLSPERISSLGKNGESRAQKKPSPSVHRAGSEAGSLAWRTEGFLAWHRNRGAFFSQPVLGSFQNRSDPHMPSKEEIQQCRIDGTLLKKACSFFTCCR